MVKLTGDIHFCEFCEKDTILTDEDNCAECGRNFTSGMEEEELLAILKNYRELIKIMFSFFDSFSKNVSFESVRDDLQVIRDYVGGNYVDSIAAREAVDEIVNRLKGT